MAHCSIQIYSMMLFIIIKKVIVEHNPKMKALMAFQRGELFDKIIETRGKRQEKMWPLKHNSEEMDGKAEEKREDKEKGKVLEN